jgi:hypothetical protein
MYQHVTDDMDISYVYSSRDCFNTASETYKDYILSKFKHHSKLVLVDLHGYGRSFLHFINTYKLDNIQIVAFDIDDTITNVSDYAHVKNMVHLAIAHNIKIILVTSRERPYTFGPIDAWHLQPIPPILDRIGFDYGQFGMDVWYNPYSMMMNHVQSSTEKLKALEYYGQQYNISKQRMIFFDDAPQNIMCVGAGGIKSVLVNKGQGICAKCFNEFQTFLTAHFEHQIESSTGTQTLI